jgi:hypothetical protein
MTARFYRSAGLTPNVRGKYSMQHERPLLAEISLDEVERIRLQDAYCKIEVIELLTLYG